MSNSKRIAKKRFNLLRNEKFRLLQSVIISHKERMSKLGYNVNRVFIDGKSYPI